MSALILNLTLCKGGVRPVRGGRGPRPAGGSTPAVASGGTEVGAVAVARWCRSSGLQSGFPRNFGPRHRSLRLHLQNSASKRRGV
jgi:hypothetical protein